MVHHFLESGAIGHALRTVSLPDVNLDVLHEMRSELVVVGGLEALAANAAHFGSLGDGLSLNYLNFSGIGFLHFRSESLDRRRKMKRRKRRKSV